MPFGTTRSRRTARRAARRRRAPSRGRRRPRGPRRALRGASAGAVVAAPAREPRRLAQHREVVHRHDGRQAGVAQRRRGTSDSGARRPARARVPREAAGRTRRGPAAARRASGRSSRAPSQPCRRPRRARDRPRAPPRRRAAPREARRAGARLRQAGDVEGGFQRGHGPRPHTSFGPVAHALQASRAPRHGAPVAAHGRGLACSCAWPRAARSGRRAAARATRAGCGWSSTPRSRPARRRSRHRRCAWRGPRVQRSAARRARGRAGTSRRPRSRGRAARRTGRRAPRHCARRTGRRRSGSRARRPRGGRIRAASRSRRRRTQRPAGRRSRGDAAAVSGRRDERLDAARLDQHVVVEQHGMAGTVREGAARPALAPPAKPRLSVSGRPTVPSGASTPERPRPRCPRARAAPPALPPRGAERQAPARVAGAPCDDDGSDAHGDRVYRSPGRLTRGRRYAPRREFGSDKRPRPRRRGDRELQRRRCDHARPRLPARADCASGAGRRRRQREQ